MKNREYYQETFDEVHASEAVLRKVRGMKMEEKKIRKRSKLQYGAVVAAALGICIVASNGICYAATGNTWVEKVVLYINGEPVEQDITWHQNEDGVYGYFEYETDGETPVSIALEAGGEGPASIGLTRDDGEEIDMEATDTAYVTSEIREENGRIYLVIGESKVDITEDMADGVANGSFEYEGSTLHYEVTGNTDDYSITIE